MKIKTARSGSQAFLANAVLLVPINFGIVHPASGEESESRKESEGGYVSVWKDKDSPITKLRLHKIDGFPTAQFKLSWTSTKIRIWKNNDKTGPVTSNSTTFPTNVDTDVYLEGVTKSEDKKDVEVGLKLVIGTTEATPVKVKLTVVEAEFLVELKMWIREQWIDVPFHPIDNPFSDQIAGGDDRDNSVEPATSFRVCSRAILIPYADLDSDGIRDRVPTSLSGGIEMTGDTLHNARRNFPGISTMYDKPDSVPHPDDGYSQYNRFLPGATPNVSNAPNTSRMLMDPVETSQSNSKTITLRMHGAASDPNIIGSADIDWDLKVKIDANDPIFPKVSVSGSRDNYPSFEVNVSDSNEPVIQPYFWLYGPEYSVWSLAGPQQMITPTAPMIIP